MKSEKLQSEPVVVKEKVKNTKNYYIDPIRFKELILEYYNTDDFSEELGEMINNISQHVAYMPNFSTYTYPDEMISDSNWRMVRALNQHKFDPTKGNPFSYFTKICCRAFINIIRKEKRMKDTVIRYQNEMYDELALNGLAIDHADPQVDNYCCE